MSLRGYPLSPRRSLSVFNGKYFLNEPDISSYPRIEINDKTVVVGCTEISHAALEGLHSELQKWKLQSPVRIVQEG